MAGTTTMERQQPVPAAHEKSNGTATKQARVRGSSIGAREAESHIPTLKNQGKSDCGVRIVSILEAKSDIPVESLSAQYSFCKSAESRDALLSARSEKPLNAKFQGLAINGSRTLQAQRARRRPNLDSRESDAPKQGHRRRPSLTSAKSFVSGNTIRRLTSGMWCVRKEAFSGAKQDGGRLLKQIEKQIRFSAWTRTNNMKTTLSTPEVYGISVTQPDEHTTSIAVDMEYIPYNDVKHVMLEKDRFINEWLIDAAIELVDSNLSSSTSVPLSECLPEFAKKAASIKKALAGSKLASADEKETFIHQIDRIMEHYTRLQHHVKVPVGNCHGDLTFANFLIDTENREFCMFDFLDCFVESPLQDIAKLLQDARHQWFLTQTTIPEDKHARATSMLTFYYEKIKAAYSEYAIWDLVPLFEFFCLARILPYMTEEKEKICILNGLERIYKDLFSNSTPPSPTNEVDLSLPYDAEDEGKTTVIVPALGAAMEAPYPGGQIKLLTLNSNGRPLIVDSLSNLITTNVSRIVIVVLRSVITAHCGSTQAFESMFNVLGLDTSKKIAFYYADQQSSDAVDSVAQAIRGMNIQGSIFIKDADNDFTHTVFNGNYITFTSLVRDDEAGGPVFLRPDLVDAVRKSYVSFFYDNVISNVSYSSFLSSDFCCGGWGFLKAEDFIAASEKLRTLLRSSGLPRKAGSDAGDLRVVDIVWQLVCEGHLFFGLKVDGYKDWGSQGAWLASLNARFQGLPVGYGIA